MEIKIIRKILSIFHIFIFLIPVWIVLLSKKPQHKHIVNILFAFYMLIPTGWYLFDCCVLTKLENKMEELDECECDKDIQTQNVSFVSRMFGTIVDPCFQALNWMLSLNEAFEVHHRDSF